MKHQHQQGVEECPHTQIHRPVIHDLSLMFLMWVLEIRWQKMPDTHMRTYTHRCFYEGERVCVCVCSLDTDGLQMQMNDRQMTIPVIVSPQTPPPPPPCVRYPSRESGKRGSPECHICLGDLDSSKLKEIKIEFALSQSASYSVVPLTADFTTFCIIFVVFVSLLAS